MKRQLILLVILILIPVTSSLAQKRAFTIEDLYRIKSISDVHISPDGRSILYVVSTYDMPRARRTMHIWKMDIDGGNARQLTQGEIDSHSPRWSPDSKWIAFIKAEGGYSNLYVMPATGGDARRVTNVSTGVYDPLFSPDGEWLAFSTDVYPKCGSNEECNKKTTESLQNKAVRARLAEALPYRQWSFWRNDTRTHIFLASTNTDEVRDLTPGNFDSPPFSLTEPLQYDFSPDGKELVFVSNRDPKPAVSTNNDIWLVSVADSEATARNITVRNQAYDSSPRYSPDGKFIAYRTQKQSAYDSDLFRLAVYDRTSNATKLVTESFNNWVEDFKWADDSSALYFQGPVEGQNPLYRIDMTTRAITQVLSDKNIITFDINAQRIVYAKSSVAEPIEIYSAELRDGKAETPIRLTNFNDAVANEVDIRPAEQMWVTGAEGKKVQVFIVKPHAFNPSKKYPLILNVHGGPQSNWSDSFRGDWQVYPGAGYVVAFCNPHGSTGYGQDYTTAVSGDWGGKIFKDLMSVTDALEKLPYVDRDKMGAMGWGYGGYMVNWFEAHTDRFKALASMMGIYNLTSFYGSTDSLISIEWEMEGQPWNSVLYDKWSPSSYVKNFKTPCLIIGSERNYYIPYTQGLEMFTALQRMGIDSTLIIFPNSSHWPNWYEMVLYYTAHLEWFHKYLGGDKPPWTSEQFLRNAVFDTVSGKRITDKAVPSKNKMENDKKPYSPSN